MSKEELNKLSNKELWQLFPIIISEPKKEWKEKYLAEEQYLLSLIDKKHFHCIHHIGSTAVPGLVAKPTIDILLEITEDTFIPGLIETMEANGYIYSPQPKNPPPHLLFMKGYTIHGFRGQAYHLHVRYPGEWDELIFRDYLIGHPEEVITYGKLKESLSVQYRNNRDGYTAAKTDFIKRCLEQAKKDRYL